MQGVNVNKLVKTIKDAWFPDICAENYDNVESFWKSVDSRFEDWKESLANELNVTTEELDSFVASCNDILSEVSNEDWLQWTYNSYYFEDAWNAFPEAYEYNPHFKCSVCGRPIQYDSRDTVVLTDVKWHQVLDYFNMSQLEDEYAKNACDWWRTSDLHGRLNGKRPENTYLFICNDCIEEALGRPIMRADLQDCPFNDEFFEEHPLLEFLNESFATEPYDVQTQMIFNAAKKMFGVTYDIREAGYVLPDGTMLDFSGRHDAPDPRDSYDFKGRRTSDHRDIDNIKYISDAQTDICDFIKRGAIRIDVHAGAINLYLKPTKEQKEVLRRLIVKNEGYVYIDFGYDETEHYVEYDGARYTKILSDIDRYFDEGIKP